MKKWHPLNRAFFYSGRIHLAGHLMSSKGDRVAMNSSVEMRYPFLDDEVFNFLARIHPNWKLRGFKDKYILRLLGERYLPHEAAWRPKGMFRPRSIPSSIARSPPSSINFSPMNRSKRPATSTPKPSASARQGPAQATQLPPAPLRRARPGRGGLNAALASSLHRRQPGRFGEPRIRPEIGIGRLSGVMLSMAEIDRYTSLTPSEGFGSYFACASGLYHPPPLNAAPFQQGGGLGPHEHRLLISTDQLRHRADSGIGQSLRCRLKWSDSSSSASSAASRLLAARSMPALSNRFRDCRISGSAQSAGRAAASSSTASSSMLR